MLGNRVVVPEKLIIRNLVLQELHEGHIGIVKMKSIARSFVWWPKMDQDIEKFCFTCSGCQRRCNMPNSAPVHPWDWPKEPWDRLRIDFAEPFMNSMFLHIIDAHSKWVEIFPMNSTTTTNTIEKRRIFIFSTWTS